MLSRVERTTLLPLAMQLENAERYQQQAAAAEAAAAAAGVVVQPQLYRQGSAPDTPTGSRRFSRTSSDGGSSSGGGALSRGGSLPVSRKASVLAPVSSGGRLSSQGSGGMGNLGGLGVGGGSYDGEDELAMLQQEVALFGMVSTRGSSAEASASGGAGEGAQDVQQG
jgi:hypothetical protein